jgi:prefoldin subunit 5
MEKDLAMQLDAIQKQLGMLQQEVSNLREAVEGQDLSAVVHLLESKVTRILEFLEHRVTPFD